MAFNFINLEQVRDCMFYELQDDIVKSRLYISKRLLDDKKDEWIKKFQEAVINHNEVWLTNQIGDIFKRDELRAGKIVAVPVNANVVLAEGEFNRLYIKAICIFALKHNQPEVEICRGKIVGEPRVESINKIGTRVDAQKLLADLRNKVGIETALSVPGGPGSGITVKLI